VDHSLGSDHDVLGALAALHPDPPPAHGDRPRERAGDLGLVGDHEDRRAEVVAETVDQVEHVVAVLMAELAGRFVGEEELRRAGHAAGECQSLPLTARHRRHDLMPVLLEADPTEQLGVAEGAVGVAAGGAAEAQVLLGRRVVKQVAGRALEHRADA